MTRTRKPPTDRRTKAYKAIVQRGCAVVHGLDGDADCTHRYPWDCEQCPVVDAEQWKEHKEAQVAWSKITVPSKKPSLKPYQSVGKDGNIYDHPH